jgi:hypothetical protein
MTMYARTDAAADVPSAELDAILDPHWRELQGTSRLPAIYLPPAMPRDSTVVAQGCRRRAVLGLCVGDCLRSLPDLRPIAASLVTSMSVALGQASPRVSRHQRSIASAAVA